MTACGSRSAAPQTGAQNPDFEPPRVVGKIRSKDIPESSGVAASRCQRDVLWTHNDSGNDNFVFAIDPAGEVLAAYRVTDTKNRDWEDIASYKDAAGKCYVYIGEIGDNDEKNLEHTVYRIEEPVVPVIADPKRKDAVETGLAQRIRFRYPDSAHNAETLMVHPVTGEIYIVTKRRAGPAEVYKILPDFTAAEPQTAKKVGAISVPAVPNGLLTGGDISPDGRHVILCDYAQGYELTLNNGASNFDDIWSATPEPVDLGKRPHGEGVCYNVDGTAVYATSEDENSPVIEVRKK